MIFRGWSEFKKDFGKEDSAFTFLELVIVVLMLGVILGTAVPAMQGPLNHYRVITSARQLESDIRNLQQQAISLEDNGYNIVFAPTFYQVRKDTSPVNTVNLPAGVMIAYNNFSFNQLNINLKGLPSNNGHVKLAGDKGENRYVIIYALTGRIRIDTVPPP